MQRQFERCEFQALQAIFLPTSSKRCRSSSSFCLEMKDLERQDLQKDKAVKATSSHIKAHQGTKSQCHTDTY